MDPGLIGALLGTLVGVAGGALGTWWSIRNTSGPRERALMVRVSVVAWIVIGGFTAGMLFLPQSIKWLLWGPYGVALPFGIVWLNRRLARIRREEGKPDAAPSPEP